MKILLVEDDSALRAALEELLLREGYEVKKASNYREARAGLDSTIDLVMLDVTLPDGDGVALCKLWRSEGAQTPILFLTAKDEELDIVRGLDAGGNDYVTKPSGCRSCSAVFGFCSGDGIQRILSFPEAVLHWTNPDCRPAGMEKP